MLSSPAGVSVESLPYTLLLLLGQFTAGTAAAVLFVQMRGTFEAAFVRTCAWMLVASATLTLFAALVTDPRRNIEGYVLEPGVLEPEIRAVALALFLFSWAYLFFVRRDDEAFLSIATGATSAGLGAVLLILMASLVREPAWSIAGPLLILFAGALTLGLATVAMVWGHWYLVNPRLPDAPLNELTLLVLGVLLIETLVTALNAIVPVGHPVESSALLAVRLVENPGFWLRVGVGLVFPVILVYMAYRSSRERSMMSATGLLYIAVGAVLAGEALGRGLLFVTGAPV
jgi:hypothetical protein